MSRPLAPTGAAVIPVASAGPWLTQAVSLVQSTPPKSALEIQRAEPVPRPKPIDLSPDETQSPLGQFMKRYSSMDSARREQRSDSSEPRPSWYNPEHSTPG